MSSDEQDYSQDGRNPGDNVTGWMPFGKLKDLLSGSAHDRPNTVITDPNKDKQDPERE